MRALLVLCILLFPVTLATRPDEVRVSVNPAFSLEGGEVHVTCRVQPAVENREVEWGIGGWTSSTRQLEGADARMTHESWLHHAPCGVGPAFCRVARAGMKDRVVTAPFEVTGCDVP